MSDPEITVGIVAWNAADHLRRGLPALRAALAGIDAQVVVVDNGSTDGTAEALAEHPWVEVLHNARNDGLTPGRNQVLDRRRGRRVLMLDADTEPRPGSVRTLLDYLDAHPHVGLVGPRLIDPDGSLQLSCRRFPPARLPFLRRPPLSGVFEHRRTVNRHLMRDYDHAAPRPVDWVMGAAQCFRAEVLPAVGRYDERIFSHGGEDTDWCLRVWQAGWQAHYVPEAVVVHAYSHVSRRRPFSRPGRRAVVDYFYMQWKHRRSRGGYAPA